MRWKQHSMNSQNTFNTICDSGVVAIVASRTTPWPWRQPLSRPPGLKRHYLLVPRPNLAQIYCTMLPATESPRPVLRRADFHTRFVSGTPAFEGGNFLRRPCLVFQLRVLKVGLYQERAKGRAVGVAHASHREKIPLKCV